MRKDVIEKDFLNKLMEGFFITDVIEVDYTGVRTHSFYFNGADGFDGRADGALRSYAQGLGLTKEDIIFLQDDTFSNNGKEGFMFTKKGIVSSETNGIIPYKFIRKIRRDDSHFDLIMINDDVISIGGSMATEKSSVFVNKINGVLQDRDVVDGFEYLRREENNGKDGKYIFNFKKKSSSSDSSCFITTAVCSSLKKPDDCDELMAMRWLRDKLRVEDSDMSALIEEYYRVAPLVVKKIDNSAEASAVYRQLWEKSISKIYNNIKEKDYHDAKLGYISMLEDLCVRYNEPLAPGIKERVNKVRSRKH